jgi:1-acyl-sn-glycerol-3-phosphate acyltransferase
MAGPPPDRGSPLLQRMRAWSLSLAGPGARERLEKLRTPANEYGVDPYGFDLEYAVAAMAPFLWLYRKYFRVQVHGIEHVPGKGRVLLVANHSGQLPFDAAMLGVALLVELDPPRSTRALVEKWVPTLPFVSTFYARLGQVVGTPENCRRLLLADEALMVFPEGVRGLNKAWSQRYQLQDFGVGFLRLALECDTPIVPVGVVGAEEQAPGLLDLAPLAKLLSMPAFPITPTGLPFPLPTRYHLWFGEPMRFEGRADDDDAVLVEKVDRVKAAVKALLDRGLAERKGIFA